MTKRMSIILIAVMLAVSIVVPIMAIFRDKNASADNKDDKMTCITIWQIDGFEGGKGSRAQYLSSIGEQCFKNKNIYVSVTSISADMARENLKQGNSPDIISYPSGFYGLENYLNTTNLINETWCNGVYCALTLDENADFSDMTKENTIVNEGKDNLTEVALALSGLNGAKLDRPTNAYLNLINGKYKYLFGTQRDVFRLKTRGVTYKIKPITQFNDLYQNVAIIANEARKADKCSAFIQYLRQNNDVSSLGLFCDNAIERTDGLDELSQISFETKLDTICSKSYIEQLKEYAKNGDINKIKNLLK